MTKKCQQRKIWKKCEKYQISWNVFEKIQMHFNRLSIATGTV